MESQKTQLDCNSRTINVSVTTETADVQYEMEKIRLSKKRERFAKFHGSYSTAMYGSPAQREQIKKEHRTALLRQVEERNQGRKSEFAAKASESKVALDYDKRCMEADREEVLRKANYLKQFRDENKKLMEQKAEEEKRRKAEEDRHDRELTKMNPINWSNTLR